MLYWVNGEKYASISYGDPQDYFLVSTLLEEQSEKCTYQIEFHRQSRILSCENKISGSDTLKVLLILARFVGN
jgi:hypothetical protein